MQHAGHRRADWAVAMSQLLHLQHFHSIFILYGKDVRKNMLEIKNLDYVMDLH
jgi:hypothetical protein